ncbi:MAG: CPBP family intramembrane metalloprotease [Anaerolineae bacterium]|nr:CPBP family intramembrane metalloprotease [Anaerolineae bacterium]
MNTRNILSRMRPKTLAILEVLLVRAAMIGVLWVLLPLAEWQQHVFGFNLLAKLIWLLLPILWLLLTRRKPATYGIHANTLKADLTAALSAFFPVAVVSGTLGFVPYTRWYGALIEVVLFIGALVWVAYSLTHKPDPQSGVITIVLACLMFDGYAWWKGSYPGLRQGIFNFVNYLIFVGLAEEVWYRGYIQTRLNQVFARRWTFFGVQWGWGVLIASLIFGFTHVLNGWNLETGEFHPLWWWGAWTTTSSLLFAYVREKTGSVVAGSILHGLPQALVYFFVKF